jgi:hypothetical protein
MVSPILCNPNASSTYVSYPLIIIFNSFNQNEDA